LFAGRLSWVLGLDVGGVASLVESTLLDPFAGFDSFRGLVLEAYRWGFRCVVVPVSVLGFVSRVAFEYGVRVCGVVGFPAGFYGLRFKVLEVEEACGAGVFEVDVVPSFHHVRGGLWGEVLGELSAIVDAARSCGASVKVIVEAPNLGDGELERLVDAAWRAGASFVKTSTGVYSKGGDPLTVYRVYRLASSRGLKVKAAGGIRTFLDLALAYAFGADTIGTSSAGRVMEDYLRFRELRTG